MKFLRFVMVISAGMRCGIIVLQVIDGDPAGMRLRSKKALANF